MKARLLPIALAVAIALMLGPGPRAQASPVDTVAIDLDRTVAVAHVGDRFTFRTTIRNTTGRPLRSLVAHLNVLSLDPTVYVDPEDWSSARTQYVNSVAASGSTTVAWTVRAVNQGRFILYVTVASQRDSEEVDASLALRATVTAQQTLSATGVLPIVLSMPAITLVLLIASLRRRRKSA